MHTDNHKVSLLICSKDRQLLLKKLISNILKIVSLHTVSVHIIDQSQHKLSPIDKQIHYIHTPNETGLGVARNKALSLCASSLVAFTDDDCVITKQYARSIQQLRTHIESKKVAIIFGQTVPFEPYKHTHEHCPCTFYKSKTTITNRISPHWSDAGYGNNMIVNRRVIESVGRFKPWLGEGSIGESGEDAEFVLRCLIAGYTIDYDPNLLIRHNRWLSERAWRQQLLKYTCGGLAAYGFYYFQGVKECKPMIKDQLIEVSDLIRDDMHAMLSTPNQIGYRLGMIVREFYAVLKGLVLAFIYGVIIPIPDKENVVQKHYRQRNNLSV